MLTAAGLGIFFLAASAWAFKELAAIQIPAKHWDLTVSGVTSAPAPGGAVEFQTTKTATGLPESVGVGTVQSFTPGAPGQGTLAVVVTNMSKEAVQETVNQPLRLGAPGATDAPVLTISSVLAVPLFEQLYLQAGVASLILILGTIVTYYQVGVRQKSVEFLIATDAEMKKVNWSTRKEIMGSTYVVIGACFLISAAIFVFDSGLSAFFKFINILRPNG